MSARTFRRIVANRTGEHKVAHLADDLGIICGTFLLCGYHDATPDTPTCSKCSRRARNPRFNPWWSGDALPLNPKLI